MIKVSAVIPAFNESTRIQSTLSSLKQYVDEIIVVDDASTDKTRALAEQYGATVLTRPL